MKNEKIQLPSQLKKLVSSTVALLGEVIQEEAGSQTFKTVDSIRKKMVRYRSSSSIDKDKILNDLYKSLNKDNSKSKHDVAHSYTLMLELIMCAKQPIEHIG